MGDEDRRDELEMRASDSERDATARRLRDAAAEGRLTLEELAERIEAADAARTRGELARLVEDLPAERAVAPTQAARPARRRLFGILGGDTLTGAVRLGHELRVINVMGGADMDLTDALLESGEVTIHVFSLMGGSNITVPHGVRVEHSGFGLLGWDEVDPSPEDAELRSDAPIVRIRSISIMGGTDVKRGRPRPWRWPWQRRHRELPPA